MACNILLKSSWQGLHLCFKPHLNPRFAGKVMAPQNCESPNLSDFRTSIWESQDKKSYLDVGPMERCRVYYKGEGDGFPQVRAVVSLVCPCCMWLVLAPKVFQLRTNHLVWVLCKPVWVSEACQLFLVPSRSSSMPLYPSKCCELGSVPDSSLFCCFLLGLTFESFKELGVRHLPLEIIWSPYRHINKQHAQPNKHKWRYTNHVT